MESELVFQGVEITQRGVEDVVARQVVIPVERRRLRFVEERGERLLDRIAQVAPRPHDDV
jgi:ribosomal protein L13E